MYYTLIMLWFLGLMVGCEVGKNIRKKELEQKLCQAKHYEYCNNEELLNYIKK
jgi:hypothetical protein